MRGINQFYTRTSWPHKRRICPLVKNPHEGQMTLLRVRAMARCVGRRHDGDG